MNEATCLLALRDVSYAVTAEQPTIKKTLLSNIDLSIAPFEMVSIIGPNGAGKSTLVKVMLGLLPPTHGSVYKNSKLRVGYVPQKLGIPTVLPLRVKDLLAQVSKRYDITAWFGRSRQTIFHTCSASEQAELFDRLSITPLLNRQVSCLSGGEMQRVLLARSLLNKPELLILDEPMQGLDIESEQWLYAFIDDLPPFLRCAMVVVSHDLHWVMRGSRRVVCLNKHICCMGQPSEVELTSEFTRLFGHQFKHPYVHHHTTCQHGP